jgi:hypothetical protein
MTRKVLQDNDSRKGKSGIYRLFTDTMRISGKFGQKSAKILDRAGGDVVHWGFRKDELLPLTF